ncbi:MAG: hypothetical protein JNL57_08925 [Bacteroidetes bacterium]|nr:hypothetical protein [Bacteroidota bacterium]
MKDTTSASIEAFKGNLFIWEVVITAIVFVAIFYFFKAFKARETAAKEANRKFEDLLDKD